MSTSAKKIKAGVEMSDELTNALEAIDGCQNEIDSQNEKSSEEILKVEQKYNKIRRPLYEKRTQFIKKIPEFWLQSFLNHPLISIIVDEDEEECFEFLDTVDVEESEDIKNGYKLHFHFRENPYFKNKCLTKEFALGNGETPTSTSTPLEWNEGKNLIEKLQSRAQKSSSRKRRHLEFKSFFDWFSDNTDPVNDEIAEIIKDDLWPNPLQYFLVPDIEVEPEDHGDEEEDEEEYVSDDEDEDNC